MHITVLMVLTYIVCCVRIGTAPWRYFQLNAHYFSDDAGIFSKLSIDRLIPERWRLAQHVDTEQLAPAAFPVFLKPEWGQNAHGIHRADNPGELKRLRATLVHEPQRYLLQEAAAGTREFEIFGIDADRHDARHDILTVTEAVNNRERFPINSKNNRHTRYVEITDDFNELERQTLASFLGEIGRFGISRMSVRADSRAGLLAGQFKVIEINLFLPMPINLLDARYTSAERWRFIRRAMMALARSTKLIEPVPRERAIFTRMMLYGRSKAPAQASSIITRPTADRVVWLDSAALADGARSHTPRRRPTARPARSLETSGSIDS